MRRSLRAFDVTCLGIGAIIGAGIFALAGTAAAGEVLSGSIWKTPVLNWIHSVLTNSELVMGRPGAGPAVVLSFVVAAIACGFAALCYAELAAMIRFWFTYAYSTRRWARLSRGSLAGISFSAPSAWRSPGLGRYFVKLAAAVRLKFPGLYRYGDGNSIIAAGGEALQNFLPPAAGDLRPLLCPEPRVPHRAAVTILLI
jgi:hypothetical protein